MDLKSFLLGKDVRVVHKDNLAKIIIPDAFIANIFRDEYGTLSVIVVDKENGAFFETSFLQIRLKDTSVLQKLVSSYAKRISMHPDEKDITRFDLMDFTWDGSIRNGKSEKNPNEDYERDDYQEDEWADESDRNNDGDEIPF